jgi:hypothetical protein
MLAGPAATAAVDQQDDAVDPRKCAGSAFRQNQSPSFRATIGMARKIVGRVDLLGETTSFKNSLLPQVSNSRRCDGSSVIPFTRCSSLNGGEGGPAAARRQGGQ